MSESEYYTLDDDDKNIINLLQKGFPVCKRPYLEAARELGLSETELINRIKSLLENKFLTRFGPMYDAAEFGGGLTLAAMSVPEDQFETIATRLNSFKQVAHNYEREHKLNMWFVLATEQKTEIQEVIREIEHDTGLCVYNMPKQHSFFVNLYLPV